MEGGPYRIAFCYATRDILIGMRIYSHLDEKNFSSR